MRTPIDTLAPEPWGGKPHPAEVLRQRLDRMIATQMGAYPDSWTDADKREVAELHLFGRGGVA